MTTPTLDREKLAFRLAVPLSGIVAILILSLFYVEIPLYYHNLLTALMLAPFPRPFMDWEWMQSAIYCWKRGVDVYIDNTCYEPLAHLRFAYSPLWLRATFIPISTSWVNPIGLFLGVSFFIALGTLPAARSRGDLRTILLAAGSSLVAFALERENVDVILFLLTVIGLHLWSGSLRLRLVAYLVFAAAGFLKFYPFILLTLGLRERVRVSLPIAGAFLLALGAFVWRFSGELIEARRSIPAGLYFTDMFGAVNLPYGLSALCVRATQSLGIDSAGTEMIAGRVLPATLLLALVIEAMVRAHRLSERWGVRQELSRFPARDLGFLIAGALLVCGCFLTGQSVGYRGIYLLLVVPGVLRLSRTLPSRPARTVFSLTAIAIVFVMWVLTIQFFITVLGFADRPAGDESALGLAHWLLHEAAWWWIIGVLLSTIVGFALNSATYREMRQIYLAFLPGKDGGEVAGRAGDHLHGETGVAPSSGLRP